MTSKQSKHQAATGSQPKDGIRKPARLTILAIIYALCIAAAIAFHAQEGVQQLMEDPARICIWSLCFLLCLIYHKKRSSYRVAAEHTVLPPLTVILLVTGYFPDVAMFLIIVTIITSIITARSLKIGILRAGTTLAPIPLIKILFANTSHVLSIIISQNSVNAAINPYQFQHWLLPLLIMTVAVPIIRLICDIVTFFFVQIPIRKAMREYSLSHILAMALADLMAIVWIPEILEFANIGSDTATVLSVFMLALIAYSLLLMTVDTMSRLTRSRSALKCIANVSDALPLPNQVPEETVVRRINRGLTRMRCFISNANNLNKRGYSYRYSAPISTGSRQYYLAMERSIWNRPFMSTDETILLTCGEVLTESLRVNKEVTLLRTESETDTLTGALTYRAFIGHLKSLQTENVHNLVAVVYFGVEHLRTVNEHYGRKIGNAVLRSVGMRLSQLLPGNATLSRVNGAEFAMIVTDVTSTSDVEELATRMRNLAVMPVYTEEGEVSVDVSSSISFSNATDGFSVLLADADKYAGFISIGPSPLNHKTLHRLHKKLPHGVFIDINPAPALFDSVQPDLEQTILDAIDALMGSGCSRIGFIGGLGNIMGKHEYPEDIRTFAFRNWALRLGLDAQGLVYADGPFTVENGRLQGRQLVQDHADDLPDAVIVAADPLAVGVLQAFATENVMVPRDIKVISINNQEIAKYTSPALSSYDISQDELAKAAVLMLAEALTADRKISQHMRISTSLVARDSFIPQD